jgi:hypothetical protein
MDAKMELNKLWKDLQESAKEFASYGLQMGSKALDFTAAQLKTAETLLTKQAQKLGHVVEKAADKVEDAAHDVKNS